MRHSLYKYFSEHKWAEAFLDGEVLFRSLAYFRDYEDENVRKDKGEGNSIYKPAEGLLVANQTQGREFTMPGYAFEATANQEEIFVFCTSRLLSDELRRRFEATLCVEILRIPTFCERVRRALPAEANWYAGKVDYYDEREGPGPRWALPDLIARSKRKSYEWQHEYRFVFSLTDALGFEKGTFRLAKGEAGQRPNPSEHHNHLAQARSLRDICRLHEF
jgi:hypothetical protein